MKTFAVGFEGDGDDLDRARIVARVFRTEHHEMVVKPDAAGLLPWLVRHLDEPFADPSIVPTYYLAKFTREHVTVALNGDGGDETFAGYSKYWQDRAASWSGRLPEAIRSGCIPWVVARLERLGPWDGRLESLQEVLRAASLMPHERYAFLSGVLDEGVRETLYSPDLYATVRSESDPLAERYQRIGVADSVNRMLAADLQGFLSDDLLYKMDMATMAHGLEARSPFLDHRFVEFALRIPGSAKLRGHKRKAILKKALRGILPADILHRPKRGFDPPIARWLREDLREMAFDLLLGADARNRGYFRLPFIEAVLDEHSRGRRDWSSLVWRLVILEVWHREAA